MTDLLERTDTETPLPLNWELFDAPVPEPVNRKFRKAGDVDLVELRRQIEWARKSYDSWSNARAVVQRNESRWNQGQWIEVIGAEEFCRTTACIAGHTVLEAGAELNINSLGYVDDVWWEGKEIPVGDLARKLLGLTVDQANVLFSSSRTIEDLEYILDKWEQGLTVHYRDLASADD